MPVAGIAAASLGDNTIVPAVTNKKIRVKSFQLFNGAATANTVKWRSGTADLTTPVTSAAQLGLIGGLPPSHAPTGFLFETAAGAALNLNLSAATAIGGWAEYTLE